MPTSSAVRTPTNSSDALFRAWGKFISDALAAFGWTQTGDSGQINWATVTAPVAPDTVQGYEMWAMDDVLQATAPVLMKLEYGSGANTNNPAVWHTFGAAADGAGALTGLTSGRVQSRCYGAAVPGASTWIASGDVNRFVFAAAVDAAVSNDGMYLMVERTKNGSGDDTDEGLLIAYQSGNSGGVAHAQKFWPWAGTVPGAESTLGVIMPTFGTGTDGTTTAVYPLLMSRGPFLNPPLALLGCFLGNFAPGVTVDLSLYGATHTYWPTSATYATTARHATANASALLIRYE